MPTRANHGRCRDVESEDESFSDSFKMREFDSRMEKSPVDESSRLFEVELFRCLLEDVNNLRLFTEILNKGAKGNLVIEDPLSSHRGYSTLLYACERRLNQHVKLLMKYGGNPNQQGKSPIEGWTALHFAVQNADVSMVALLIEHGATSVNSLNASNQTPIHLACRGDRERPSKRKHFNKCLSLLITLPLVDLNIKDDEGLVPLHHALSRSNDEAIRILVSRGARIDISNCDGIFPLRVILERYPKLVPDVLDNYIQIDDDKALEDPNLRLTIDYSIFSLSEHEETLTYDNAGGGKLPARKEADTMSLMIETNNAHLLVHPLCSSFLQLKWHRIRFYYFANLFFFLLFAITFTIFVVTFVDIERATEREESNSTRIYVEEKVHQAVWHVIPFMAAIMFIREVFQILSDPSRYVRDLENALEWAVIIGIVCLLVGDNHMNVTALSHLTSLVVLFVWLEAMLLLGRYPSWSIYVSMLVAVFKNFLKFLAVFSLIVIAFSLSFSVLFREHATFEGFWVAALKTIVMMTGEFDFESLPLRTFPGTSHLIFLAFVFIGSIILMNLLIGLAVNDTNRINEKAIIYSAIRQVLLTAYIEKMLFSDITNWLPGCLRKAWEKLVGWTLVLNGKLPSSKLTCYPNFQKKPQSMMPLLGILSSNSINNNQDTNITRDRKHLQRRKKFKPDEQKCYERKFSEKYAAIIDKSIVQEAMEIAVKNRQSATDAHAALPGKAGLPLSPSEGNLATVGLTECEGVRDISQQLSVLQSDIDDLKLSINDLKTQLRLRTMSLGSSK